MIATLETPQKIHAVLSLCKSYISKKKKNYFDAKKTIQINSL